MQAECGATRRFRSSNITNLLSEWLGLKVNAIALTPCAAHAPPVSTGGTKVGIGSNRIESTAELVVGLPRRGHREGIVPSIEPQPQLFSVAAENARHLQAGKLAGQMPCVRP